MAKRHRKDKNGIPDTPKPDDQRRRDEAVDPSDESVFDNEALIVGKGIDSAEVSGIFSSAARLEHDSSIRIDSGVIRAEPLSESAPVDPISGLVPSKPDSDVKVDSGVAASVVSPAPRSAGTDSDNVLAESTSSGEIALPESAVKHESDVAAIDLDPPSHVTDSSVALQSFRGGKPPARIDDEATLADFQYEAGRPKSEPPLALDRGKTSEEIDLDALLADGSAIKAEAPPSDVTDPGEIIDIVDGGDSDAKPRIDKSVEITDLVDDEELAAAPAPKSAGTNAEADIDIDALLAEEPTPAPKSAAPIAPRKSKPKTMSPDDALIPVDDIPAEALGGIDDEPAPTTRPAPAAAVAEPKRGGGWGKFLGGTVLGALLTAGGAAGVWYASPQLIPDSPNKPAPPPRVVPPIELAHASLDRGEAAEAVELLKTIPDEEKAQVGVRGEARWLAYLKKQLDANAPLDKDAPDVKAALDDLAKAGDKMRTAQIESAIAGKSAAATIAALKTSEETLKTEAKTLADEKEKAESLVAGVAKTLVDAKLFDEKDKLDLPSFQKVVKDVGDGRAVLAAVNKLLEGAKIDVVGDKGVEKLLAAKKDVDDQAAAVNKLLEGEKTKEPGAKGLAEVLAQRDALAKDREELDKTVKAAFQELADAKLAPAGADPRTALAAATKTARAKAESPLAGPLGSLAGALGGAGAGVGDLVQGAYRAVANQAEVNYYRLQNALSPSPDQQVDRMIALLRSDERSPAIVADASKLAQWLLSPEAKADAVTQAKAAYAIGLAEKSRGNFPEARAAFEKAVAQAGNSKTPWAAQLKKSLAEIVDPTAFYLPKADARRAADDFAGAAREIDAGLKAMPGNARLLAERALLALEQTRGVVAPKDSDKLRQDAAAALKEPATAAVGAFVLGRIEEAEGKLDEAEKLYRQAVDASPDESASARVRLALGRLLLKDRGVAPAAPKEDKKADEKKDAASIAVPMKVGALHPLTALYLAVVVSQAPAVESEEDENDPATKKRIEDAAAIAKQLLLSKDRKVRAQGHLLMGEALTRQGLRTEGLKEYAKGIELLNSEVSMTKLLADHPAFQTPDAALRASPLLAEKHYGIGLHNYQERRFAEAEAQFRQAAAYFDRDARYFYFLGLAQLAQKTKLKRDAALYSWELASRLEANSRPNSAEINYALERIQGDTRTMLNAFRTKARTTP